MTRHIRTIAAAVVILLSGGASAAVAQVDHKSPPQLPPAAVTARGRQVLNDQVQSGRQGSPPANETACENVRKADNLKALKSKGVVQVDCQQPIAPSQVDVDWANGLANGAEVPMANFPQPTGNGEVQANGLAPYSDSVVPPLSPACVGINQLGLRTTSRTNACQLYAFIHYIVRTSDAAVLGTATFSLLTWQDLDPRSRTWTVGHAIQMQSAVDAAVPGIWTYVWDNCGPPCTKVSDNPPNDCVLAHLGELLGGSTTLKSVQDVIDRSHTATAMWTFSTITNAQNLAMGTTNNFLEARCDRSPDLVQNSGEGCVYGDFTGTLVERISDSTVTEAAQWMRDAQIKLVNHPGLRGWQPLQRASVYENAANRAISGPVCNKLPKQTGQQCDEYPFAATKQGASFGPQGSYWDVKAVNGKQNEKVGNDLSVMFSRERYLAGDTFWVDVQN